MSILSQSYLAGLNKGYAQIFGDGIAKADGPNMLVPLVCSTENASGVVSVEYDYAAGVAILKEVVDADMQKAQNITTKQKTVSNRTFSRLIYLAREKLERRQGATYNRTFSQMGPAFNLTLERLLATRVAAGFEAAGGSFFVTTSTKKAPGKTDTFTNSMVKKFSTANFDTGLETLQSQTDVEGNPLNLGTDPSKLLLVVGPKYRKTAAKCVGAKLQDGGDENVNAGVCQLKVWGQFVGSLAHHWMIIDTSVGMPFVRQDEVPVAMYMQTNPADSYVMQTGKFLSQIYWRGDVDLLEPQWCYGSSGTDAA